MSNPPPTPPYSSAGSYSMPPGFGGSGGFEPPRTNGFAVAGLVSSLFICCIGLHAVVGLVLSGVGLATSGKTRSGRGMSIAGLIISIVMLLAWTGVGIAGVNFYNRTIGPFIATTKDFTRAVESGDFATAQKFTTGKVSVEQLQSIADLFKSKGKFTTFMSSNQFTQKTTPEGDVYSTGGTMIFSGGNLTLKVTVLRAKDNKVRIVSIDVTDPSAPPPAPVTQPATAP